VRLRFDDLHSAVSRSHANSSEGPHHLRKLVRRTQNLLNWDDLCVERALTAQPGRVTHKDAITRKVCTPTPSDYGVDGSPLRRRSLLRGFSLSVWICLNT
jgi:hypothetical protein